MKPESTSIALSLAARLRLPSVRATLLTIALSSVAIRPMAAQPPEPPSPVQPQLAPSSEGITRTVLGGNPVSGTDLEMRMVLAIFPPGAGSPAHHHPTVGYNYVLEGAALSQYAGEPLKTFTAGQSFQDKPGVEHTVFQNASTTQPLKFVMFYVVKPGAPFLLIP